MNSGNLHNDLVKAKATLTVVMTCKRAVEELESFTTALFIF